MAGYPDNYEWLVIHNSAHSNKIEDQVFWYKADAHDDFKLGSMDFWNYNNEHYDEDDDDDDDQIDLSQYGRGAKLTFDVKKIE